MEDDFRKATVQDDEIVIEGTKPKKDEVSLKIPKKAFFISFIVLVVLLIAGLIWQTGVYKKIYTFVMPATLEVTVTDTVTSKPISGAEVSVGSISAKTNEEGKARLEGLSARTVRVAITANGYLDSSQSKKLKRKGNTLAVILTLNIEKTTLTGKVSNFISDSSLAGVSITSGEFQATTGSDGVFTISDIPTGEHSFKISKDGYNTKSDTTTVIKDQPATFTLAPAGKVYFVSNREGGKRGIFQSNYDGTDVTRLIKSVDGQEDYSLNMSPDHTKIAFLSTREKRKNSSSNYTPDLFVINANGTGLAKIDSTFGLYSTTWSSDSKYLVWMSHAKQDEYVQKLNIYSTKSGKVEQITSNGNVGNVVLSYDGSMVAWTQSIIAGNPTSEIGSFLRKLSGGDIAKVTDQAVYDLNFSNNNKSIRYTQRVDNSTKYYSYLISSGAISEYTPEPNESISKVLSPDGKRYAYVSSRDGKSNVFISDAEGNNERQLTDLGTAVRLSWELNNQYIVFDSSKSGETAKYILDISGGSAKKVTDVYLDNDNQGI